MDTNLDTDLDTDTKLDIYEKMRIHKQQEHRKSRNISIYYLLLT